MSDEGNAGLDGDSFTEVTSKSWFERIRESLMAILIGIVLVVVSTGLLFWNEGRSAKTSAALSEGAAAVVAVATERVDPEREGTLVHIAGDIRVGTAVRDADFGFDANALRLNRKVEMLQWREEVHSETQKKLGGGEETVTRYSYHKDWSDHAVDSSGFRRAADHRNPPMPSVSSHSFYPTDVKLGGFRLSDRIIQMLSGGEKYAVPDTIQPFAVGRFGQNARVLQGEVYVGINPDQPTIGDVRISWQILPIAPMSVVGRQTQGSITPWLASNGSEVLLVESGIADADLMFKHGQDSNSILTWALRLGGVLIMFVGFRVMFSLLSVLADVVPLFGNIVAAGTALVALLCTMVIAPIVIAIAWFFYRPLVGIAVLVVGGVVVYGLHQLMRKRVAKKARQASGLADRSGLDRPGPDSGASLPSPG
ncbi:MAG: TMEM43 family protein [Alphaproteobacteria bacterium]|nr:TMEM43 family protein [Alphaproteobacteria bacterium]